jgi:hypothetical protein
MVCCTLGLTWSCLGDDELERKHRQQKTSAILKVCPDGHATLKDIPVRYGLFGIHIRPEAEWTDVDRALAREEAERKVVLGGDVYMDVSPRFQVTCLTCGFSYEVSFVPDEGANWTKVGKSFGDFTTKFSDTALSLPFAKEPSLYIGVTLASGRVYHEFISVTLPTVKGQQMTQKLREWVVSNKFSERALSSDMIRPHEQTVESGGAKFTLTAIELPNNEGVSFTFSLHRGHEPQ